MGYFEKLAIRNNIRILNNSAVDLSNDNGAISNYNNCIDSIITDFRSFVITGNSAVISKLDGYREPYQYNDYDLVSACNYIQYEIYYQNQQLANDSDD